MDDKITFTGMVNKNNEPHGFGREIKKNEYFTDGMWNNGTLHGMLRTIWYDGDGGNEKQYIDGQPNINDWY